MIKFFLIINAQGKVRVSKYYEYLPENNVRKQETDVIKACLVREKTQVRHYCGNTMSGLSSLSHFPEDK